MTFYLPREEGVLQRRDRHAHDAQPLHAARREGARRAALERLHRRGARALRRRRGDVREPQLADLGQRERIADYLAKQRDTYKYIHDQTLRLANSGATPREIAEQLELPESLRPSFGEPRLLRHRAPQREGRLPVVLRLVRRQPREPRSAAARRGGREVRRVHGRRGRGAREGAGVVRRGRLPLGRDRARSPRVRASPTTRRRASCSRAATTSSAIAPSRVRGATCISRARTSCATASRREHARLSGAAQLLALHADRALLRRDGDAPRRPRGRRRDRSR